jgi:hypothetical protein
VDCTGGHLVRLPGCERCGRDPQPGSSGEAPFELAIFNPQGGKVDVLLSAWSADEEPAVWNGPLFDLYQAARRRALGVDELINDLLAEVRTFAAARSG